MKVVVVGAGRVGLIMAVALARLGHEVLCLEREPGRVELLRQGQSPFWEAGLAEALREELAAGRLRFAAVVEGAPAGEPLLIVPGTQVVMLCVGTPPTPTGGIDTSQLEAAVDFLLPRLEEQLGHDARGGDPTGAGHSHRVVLVTKSTVPVGTASALADRITAHGLAGRVLVASNPEFLREGTALTDALHPDRIVIGVREPEAAQVLRELYAGIDAPVVVTDWQTAELIKYAANAFLATRISLLNELADLAEATGADIVQVAGGIGLDPRIGPHYLKAGLGYGGSCLPKDVAGLMQMAADQGLAPVLLTAVAGVNAVRPGKVVAKLRQALGGTLAGQEVAVLGLSFKGGTDDLRASPALEVVRLLARAGARVRAYDPAYAPTPDADVTPSPGTGVATAPDTATPISSTAAASSPGTAVSSPATAVASNPGTDVTPTLGGMQAAVEARSLTLLDAELGLGPASGSDRRGSPAAVMLMPSAYAAAEGAAAVVVLTDWVQFTQLDWERVRQEMAGRVVLDARLCLDAARLTQLGFVYIAPGRGQYPLEPRIPGSGGEGSWPKSS